MADTAESRAVVERFVEQVANGHRVEHIDELCLPDHVLFHPALPMTVYGTEQFKRALVGQIWGPFPDHTLDVQDVIADGEHVAIRFKVTAVNTGELNGVKPTGKTINGTGAVVYRVVDGKIASSHIEEDVLKMLFDMSMVPKNMTVLYILKKIGFVRLLQKLGKVPSGTPEWAREPTASE